jgi:very-short-patch-repair endonuclease
MVAMEYDGAWHGRPGQLHADRKRLNRLVAAEWQVLHVTSVRLRNDFRGVVEETREALAHQAARLDPRALDPRALDPRDRFWGPSAAK